MEGGHVAAIATVTSSGRVGTYDVHETIGSVIASRKAPLLLTVDNEGSSQGLMRVIPTLGRGGRCCRCIASTDTTWA